MSGSLPGRILLVLQSADPPTSVGGMEALCVDLAAEFSRRGCRVAAVIPETPAFDPLVKRFRSAGAEVERLNTDGRLGRSAQVHRWWRLVRFVRRWQPDVVHLHTGGATGGLALVATARTASHATVVVTEHDVPSDHVSLRDRITRRALDGLSHRTVAVSRRNAALRRVRLGAQTEKFAAILNGIEISEVSRDNQAANRRTLRSKLGIDGDATVFGSLVRLAEGKGLDDMLRAFAIVRKERPCELLLVGDGPLRGDLEGLAESLGVRESVKFAGHQVSPGAFLDTMDVFALSVPSGSMSIALLEAMARGLPPVITFCGPEEAVIDGETGLCASPNDPGDLARAFRRLVMDSGLRRQLGIAASNHVRSHFSIQRVADDLLDLYRPINEGGVPARLRASGLPNPRPGAPGCPGCLSPDAPRVPSAGNR